METNSSGDELLKTSSKETKSRGTEKPTPWVNIITTIYKPDGSLRICLDPTDLNKGVMREHVAIPAPEELYTKLTGAKVFSGWT